MNFSTTQTNASSKLPGLALVISLHMIVFGLIIKNIHERNHGTVQPPPIQLMQFEAPKPQEEIKKPENKELKPKKSAVFTPKREIEPIRSEKPDDSVLRTSDDEKPHQTTTQTGADEGSDEKAVLPPAKTSAIQIAAVVDARNCEKPEYPRTALRNGDTGIVTLAMLIGVDGRVIDSRIEKSSGVRELDKAAQAGLSLCRFKPGSIDGVAQQSWTTIQYAWKLDH